MFRSVCLSVFLARFDNMVIFLYNGIQKMLKVEVINTLFCPCK